MIEDDPISCLRYGEENNLLDRPEWKDLKRLSLRRDEDTSPVNSTIDCDSERANPTIKNEKPEAQLELMDTSSEGAEAEVGSKSKTKVGRKIQPRDIYAGTFLGRAMVQTQNQPQYRIEQYEAGGISNRKFKIDKLNSSYLQGLEWTQLMSDMRSPQGKRVMLEIVKECDPLNKTLESWHPMALAAKDNDADTPNWNQAMNGPNAQGFWEACRKELDTLETMKVWDVVDREDWMEVIPTTWALKIKRFPSGLVRKLKSRFCIRGDKEVEGIHYWETYAPVVNWTTVRLMLILSAQLGLETLQVDYTAAFVHANVETPPGYDDMTPDVHLSLPKCHEDSQNQESYIDSRRTFTERRPRHVFGFNI